VTAPRPTVKAQCSGPCHKSQGRRRFASPRSRPRQHRARQCLAAAVRGTYVTGSGHVCPESARVVPSPPNLGTSGEATLGLVTRTRALGLEPRKQFSRFTAGTAPPARAQVSGVDKHSFADTRPERTGRHAVAGPSMSGTGVGKLRRQTPRDQVFSTSCSWATPASRPLTRTPTTR
jgi:hypothetical protein